MTRTIESTQFRHGVVACRKLRVGHVRDPSKPQHRNPLFESRVKINTIIRKSFLFASSVTNKELSHVATEHPH